MDLVTRVKEFYLLETFQLALYSSQIASLENEYIEKAYERILELERHHVDFYKNLLHDLGEDVPKTAGTLTSMAGHFVGGTTLDFTTAENRYKLGMAVENKAIEMYRVFIMESWAYPDIRKKAFHNMVDEELHLLWFKDNLKHTTSLVQ